MDLEQILAALADLRRRRAEHRDAARALVAAARAANRDLTEEEGAQFDERMAAIRSLNAEEARYQALEADERARAGGPPAPSDPPERTDPTRDQGWSSFGEMLRAVAIAERSQGRQLDRRLVEVPATQSRAASGAGEAVPSDGGFLVQQDFSTTLLQRTYETGQVIGEVMRIPVSSNANGLKLNGIDETSRATGSRWGGVRTYRAAEADTVTASRPKFRRISLELQKLMALCYATDELLEDTAALESVVMTAFPQEFGWRLDNEVIRGIGAGEMLGVLNAPSLVTVAKETGQAAASFYYENAVNMFARLWAPSVPRSKWYINQDVYPQLLQMSMVVGTGGAPVFLPPGGASAAPYGSLLGRPIQPIEQASTLGTVGDVILMDPTQYVMIEKGGLKTASSIHVRFLYDEQVFRFTMRNDGQPLWHSALTPANGSNTVSPYVALATRS